jgi:hypothetical protein
MNAFATLRSLVRKPGEAETCDRCGIAVPKKHQHFIEPQSGRLVCTCDACTTLFQRGETTYKRVPLIPHFLNDFRLTDAQWDSLMIPIGLAFFLKRSVAQRVVALYPSPAGAVESLLSLDMWTDILAENPALAGMEPDIEALLVNRLRSPAEYCISPIDQCYELVGLIRTRWHGLSGGEEMWTEIHKFFRDLKDSSYA